MSRDVTDHLAIRRLASGDRSEAVEVINAAARWYREFLPPEEMHDPEMDEAAWEAEARRMTWWGAFVGSTLVGVMGSEPIGEVALLRHAYILPGHQRKGVASALVEFIEERLPGVSRVIVGTYAANYKARGYWRRAVTFCRSTRKPYCAPTTTSPRTGFGPRSPTKRHWATENRGADLLQPVEFRGCPGSPQPVRHGPHAESRWQ